MWTVQYVPGMPFKTEIGQHFPAEAYAYVVNPEKPETWFLRTWESVRQKATAAQISRCVAALSATRMGRGLQIPEGDLPGVKAKLTAMWQSVNHELPLPTVLKTFTVAVDNVATFTSRTSMPPLVKTSDGDYAVLGMKIFKTGTFRDSAGEQHTIDSDYLHAAADNFWALKETGVLPNVPWRKDHTRSVESVVGYFDAAYVDPTGEFLMCDFAFTDDHAAAQYAQGKFRSRSVEIGAHTTNAEETYDPVIMGCAFVDLPAVEGLYSHPATGSAIFPFEEITEMPTFTIKGIQTSDEKSVQDHINALEAEAAKAPTPHSFTLGTTPLADPAAVQAQLDRIPQFEAFLADATQTARSAAVDKAVAENKVAAPQAVGLKAFVATLSNEQFTAWAKTMDDAPAIPAFGPHMGGGNGDERNPNDANGVPNAIEDAKSIVAMMVASGKSEAVIKETPSYKRLIAANVAVNLF